MSTRDGIKGGSYEDEANFGYTLSSDRHVLHRYTVKGERDNHSEDTNNTSDTPLIN